MQSVGISFVVASKERTFYHITNLSFGIPIDYESGQLPTGKPIQRAPLALSKRSDGQFRNSKQNQCNKGGLTKMGIMPQTTQTDNSRINGT